jgi:hypothetical protein
MEYSKENLVLQFMTAIVSGRAGQERTIAQLSTEVEGIKKFAVKLSEEFCKNHIYKFQVGQDVVFNSREGVLRNVKASVKQLGGTDKFTKQNQYYIEYWGNKQIESGTALESELSLVDT